MDSVSKREERYAEAIREYACQQGMDVIRAVMAVADAELAEARATIDRLGEQVASYRDSVVPAHQSNAAGWAARAEKAEAEVTRLRATIGSVKALAGEWERVAMTCYGTDTGGSSGIAARSLRAALAPQTEATR